MIELQMIIDHTKLNILANLVKKYYKNEAQPSIVC